MKKKAEKGSENLGNITKISPNKGAAFQVTQNW